ncbi:hypothetical protein Tco_0760095 [Tanacetum coccineum]
MREAPAPPRTFNISSLLIFVTAVLIDLFFPPYEANHGRIKNQAVCILAWQLTKVAAMADVFCFSDALPF